MPILKDLSAADLKEQGNKLYRHQKYKEALDYYSRAIVSGLWALFNCINCINCLFIVFNTEL